jgi:hypothetical protein
MTLRSMTGKFFGASQSRDLQSREEVKSRILIAAAADSDIEFDPGAIGGGGGAPWPPASVLD